MQEEECLCELQTHVLCCCELTVQKLETVIEAGKVIPNFVPVCRAVMKDIHGNSKTVALVIAAVVNSFGFSFMSARDL